MKTLIEAKTYQATFQRIVLKHGKRQYEPIHTIIVDDRHVSKVFTLACKAFRQAPPSCSLADKLTLTRIL